MYGEVVSVPDKKKVNVATLGGVVLTIHSLVVAKCHQAGMVFTEFCLYSVTTPRSIPFTRCYHYSVVYQTENNYLQAALGLQRVACANIFFESDRRFHLEAGLFRCSRTEKRVTKWRFVGNWFLPSSTPCRRDVTLRPDMRVSVKQLDAFGPIAIYCYITCNRQLSARPGVYWRVRLLIGALPPEHGRYYGEGVDQPRRLVFRLLRVNHGMLWPGG